MGNKCVKQRKTSTKSSGEEKCDLPNDSNHPTTPELDHIPTVESQEVSTYITKYDYDCRTVDDMSFRKGDMLSVINTDDEDWWFARSKDNGKEGYIPSNYVAEWKSLEVQQWYFGRIGIIGAVNQLIMDCNQCGSYLVRDNETVTSREYQLLVRDKDRIKSYDIKRLENGNFFISEHATFENIQNLIAHYQQQADGLCSSLMYPCILANDLKPQTAGLSKQTNEEWDIDHRQLVFCRTIGFGQFANILEGVWNGTTPVAIKTLKTNITTDFQEFLLEVTIMRKLRHPNLVQLYAVCTKKEPIYIITELMKDGSLLDYLRGEGRSLKLPQLIDISAQVASGMAYLEEQCYVHKDLAARNVLVENMICKVSDSVIVHAIDDDFCAPEGYTSRIKWTAPEGALYNRYSLKSDVWSYGIVLYEIFTHGRIPYSGMSFGLHDVYERGHRMQKPMDCPDKIYEIMLECWEEEPSARPTFSNLKCFLEDFFLSKDDFWVLQQ